MASGVVLTTGVFIALMLVFSGAYYIEAQKVTHINEVIEAQESIVNKQSDGKIELLEISNTSSSTNIKIKNTGNINLDGSDFDLYVNNVLISRDLVLKNTNLVNVSDNITLTHNSNLNSSGTKVLVTSQTGSFISYTYP